MNRFLVRAAWATVLTGVVGYPLIAIIERTAFKGHSKGEIEMLFARLDLIAPALFAAGVLILIAGLRERGEAKSATARPEYERSIVLSGDNVTFAQAGWMGAVQGLCLPFRGFSRSGATISTGLLVGASRQRAERFSFALAVIITPLVIAREAERLLKAKHVADLAGNRSICMGAWWRRCWGWSFLSSRDWQRCGGLALGWSMGGGICLGFIVWWLRRWCFICTTLGISGSSF